MKNKILGLAVILLATIACGVSTPSTPVFPVVAATAITTLSPLPETPSVVEASATAPPIATQDSGQITPDGSQVNTGEVSFLIPNGIANDATSVMTTEVEFPYINPSFGDMPQHLKLTLNLYALTGKLFEPQILIFRSAEYAQYSEMNASVISAIQSLQYVDGQPLPEILDSTFSAQIHAVNFKNGHGVRYLSQVFQNFMPANNYGLFYYYQGMTNDGQFYTQAILPINAPFLPADENPNTPLPADSIPFNTVDFPGYLEVVTQKLNSTDTFSFTPYLDHLDAMIESLQVTGY